MTPSGRISESLIFPLGDLVIGDVCVLDPLYRFIFRRLFPWNSYLIKAFCVTQTDRRRAHWLSRDECGASESSRVCLWEASTHQVSLLLSYVRNQVQEELYFSKRCPASLTPSLSCGSYLGLWALCHGPQHLFLTLHKYFLRRIRFKDVNWVKWQGKWQIQNKMLH